MDSLRVQELKGSVLGVFCGPGVPLPIMSSAEHLTLVFRSITSGPHVTGYRALYSFLNGAWLVGWLSGLLGWLACWVNWRAGWLGGWLEGLCRHYTLLGYTSKKYRRK